MKKIILFSLFLFSLSGLNAQMPETDIWVFKMLLPSSNDPKLQYQFSDGENITNRPGYDNQPWFSANGKTIYWTSVRDSGETDIYCHNSKGTSRVTKTAVSEYSPQFIPGTKSMTCVVVEQDSTQRLWKYDESKNDSLHAETEILCPDLTGVAYYKWLDKNVVFLAVLPEPMSLYVLFPDDLPALKVASNAGRSFGVYQDYMFCTIQDSTGAYWIHEFSSDAVDMRGQFAPLKCPEGSQDFAVTKSGKIFMAQGTKLYSYTINTKGEWKLEHDFAADGLHRITRLAISPDGTQIALTDNL